MAFIGGCANICLIDINQQRVTTLCGPCVASAGGSQACAACVPLCRRSKENGGIDCTDAAIFKGCVILSSTLDFNYEIRVLTIGIDAPVHTRLVHHFQAADYVLRNNMRAVQLHLVWKAVIAPSIADTYVL